MDLILAHCKWVQVRLSDSGPDFEIEAQTPLDEFAVIDDRDIVEAYETLKQRPGKKT